MGRIWTDGKIDYPLCRKRAVTVWSDATRQSGADTNATFRMGAALEARGMYQRMSGNEMGAMLEAAEDRGGYVGALGEEEALATAAVQSATITHSPRLRDAFPELTRDEKVPSPAGGLHWA
ncbi:hypothetical protein E4U53_000630 [Claviceps sorghi]|nr:hypothetical protein E4U53_000630 [Claviceps sorghi]